MSSIVHTVNVTDPIAANVHVGIVGPNLGGVAPPPFDAMMYNPDTSLTSPAWPLSGDYDVEFQLDCDLSAIGAKFAASQNVFYGSDGGAGDPVAAGVLVGHTLVISTGVNAGSYTVAGVTTAGMLFPDGTFPDPTAAAGYQSYSVTEVPLYTGIAGITRQSEVAVIELAGLMNDDGTGALGFFSIVYLYIFTSGGSLGTYLVLALPNSGSPLMFAIPAAVTSEKFKMTRVGTVGEILRWEGGAWVSKKYTADTTAGATILQNVVLLSGIYSPDTGNDERVRRVMTSSWPVTVSGMKLNGTLI
jgi:hypothetical protein